MSRQASPPITNDPDCTLYDGYFYTTPQNYTWQLQCSNSYDGTILGKTTDTTDLGSCVAECINYNRANAPGACIAVTFSGSYSLADTVCTQYSSVAQTYLASEDGGEYTRLSDIYMLYPSCSDGHFMKQRLPRIFASESDWLYWSGTNGMH
jgi:hypothetical protein